jgi:hypothetical protein
MAGIGKQFDWDSLRAARTGGLRSFPFGEIVSGCKIASAVVATDQKSINVNLGSGVVALDGKEYTFTPGSVVNLKPTPFGGATKEGWEWYMAGPVLAPIRQVVALTLDEIVAAGTLNAAYLAAAGTAGLGYTQAGGNKQNAAKVIEVAKVPAANEVVISDLNAPVLNGAAKDISYMRLNDGKLYAVRYYRKVTTNTWETYDPTFEEVPTASFRNQIFNQILGVKLSALDEKQVWTIPPTGIAHASTMGSALIREAAGVTTSYFLGKFTPAGLLAAADGTTALAAAANVLTLGQSVLSVNYYPNVYSTGV